MGGALLLDGDDDGIEVASSDTLNPTSGLTISAWLKLAAQPNDYQLVLDKQLPLNPVGYLMTFVPGNYLVTRITLSNGGQAYAILSGPFPVQEWFHLAATYDGATLRVYVNGEERAASSASGNRRADRRARRCNALAV